MIIIDEDVVLRELIKRIEDAFLLPEVQAIKIREFVIKKTQSKEDIFEISESAVKECYHDVLSDIDMTILVKFSSDDLTEEQYMERIERLGFDKENCLGLVYVKENRMYRIILKNGMRYDYGFEFIHDEKADKILLEPKKDAEDDNERWSISNIDRFWFVQIQAIAKLYRNDFLISDHLANVNINETLVQQMVLRDIEYGTNFHRYGYKDNLEYMQNDMMECPYKSKNPTFNIIASKIYSAAIAYDRLELKLCPQYKGRKEILFSIWDYYEKALFIKGRS